MHHRGLKAQSGLEQLLLNVSCFVFVLSDVDILIMIKGLTDLGINMIMKPAVGSLFSNLFCIIFGTFKGTYERRTLLWNWFSKIGTSGNEFKSVSTYSNLWPQIQNNAKICVHIFEFVATDSK